MADVPTRPELPARFYKEATVTSVDGGFSVALDGRSVKTPGRNALRVPTADLAERIADEWRAQGERIDPATMPVTRLANTIVDGVVANPQPVRDDLYRYAETDLLAYRADAPDRLVARQKERWDPVLAWLEGEIGALFAVGAGVIYVAQPTETLNILRNRVAQETDPYRLAALHQITTLTGSLVLALATASRRLSASEAWELAHLDEDWNIELWGEDAEASERRASRFEDMQAAALFLGEQQR